MTSTVFNKLSIYSLNSNQQNLKIAEIEKPIEESMGFKYLNQISKVQKFKKNIRFMVNQTTEVRFMVNQTKKVRSILNQTKKVRSILNQTKDVRSMVSIPQDKDSDQHKKTFTNESFLPEPNYTQIPNVIFDYWMSHLKPGAFKILLCICRKTFGWHKTEDTISKNQLIKCTGMTKNSVQTAIKELEKANLLLKHQHQNVYGFQPNTYSLSIKKPQDETYSEDKKMLKGRSKIDLGVGQKLTQGVGQKLTPQKKDLTKQRLTKTGGVGDPKKVDEPGGSLSAPTATDVFVFFFDLLKYKNPKFKRPNENRWIIEIAKMMRIDKRTPQELKDVLQWAFDQQDPFWPTAIQSPETLRKLFDRAWTKMNHKTKDKIEKEKNAQKQSRIEQNKAWATSILPNLNYRNRDQKIDVLEHCLWMANGQECFPVGYDESHFKQIVLGKLKNWEITIS